MNTNGIQMFCLGLGVGIAGAMLFAPKSGAETRKDIRDKAYEGADYMKGQAQEAADAASNLIDRGVLAARAQREGLKAAVEAGRSAYRQSMAAAPGAAVNS